MGDDIAALVCAIKMLVGQMQAEGEAAFRRALLEAHGGTSWGPGGIGIEAWEAERLRLQGDWVAALRRSGGMRS